MYQKPTIEKSENQQSKKGRLTPKSEVKSEVLRLLRMRTGDDLSEWHLYNWFDFSHHYRKQRRIALKVFNNNEPHLDNLAYTIFQAINTNEGLYEIDRQGSKFYKEWRSKKPKQPIKGEAGKKANRNLDQTSKGIAALPRDRTSDDQNRQSTKGG